MSIKLLNKLENIEHIAHSAKYNDGFTEESYLILEQELQILKRYISINIKPHTLPNVVCRPTH